MPRKRTNMIIQKEILHLKDLGLSQRKIARNLGISRDTVRKYYNGAPETVEYPVPEWAKEINWEQVNSDTAKKKKRVPIKIIYEELSEVHKLPSYQAFCKYLKNHKPKKVSSAITVRVHRPPGESVEVDYSGDSVEIINPATGEVYRVELFVGALSYSSDFYAEFTESQRLPDFIDSHCNMFSYFGGVAKYIIPDNCKTAVIKTDKYDPTINKTYHDMCRHYGIAVDPADAYSPTHKPTVEKSVHIIQQDFIPRIRNKTYTSLYDLNKDLHEWLALKREVIMKDRGNSRKFFFEKEKHLLKALPSDRYELHNFKTAKVHPDCHIQHDKSFYSVPYQFVGKEVDVKFSNKMIHIFYNTERIATHILSKANHQHVTEDSHYPEHKIVQFNYHIKKARVDAKKIGSNMGILIERIISGDRFPLKTLRKVQGILHLQNKYSNEALDDAAATALEFDKLGYYAIRNFAKHYKPIKSNDPAPSRDRQLICLQGGKSE